MIPSDCLVWYFDFAGSVRPYWSCFAVVAQVLDEDVSESAIAMNVHNARVVQRQCLEAWVVVESVACRILAVRTAGL